MDLDGIGYAQHLKEQREKVLANVPASARARILGLPQPVAREALTVKDAGVSLRAELALLREELAVAKRENGRLTILLREMSRPIEERVEPSMREVIAEFCRLMNEAGRNVDGEPWSDLMIKTKRSMHPISRPRQVCMWLVRQICRSPSLPMIAAAFGKKDHTTVMHACKKAHDRMEADPCLLHVSIAVFRKFGVDTTFLEKAGEP